MNILEFCLSPSLGGLELYVFRSAKALSETDTVFALLHPKGRLKARFDQAALPYECQEAGWGFFLFPAARRIAAFIDRHRIDVLHVHWGKDLPLAALSKWLSHRKPRLIYTRQMKITRSKTDPYHRFLYGQMDLMLTISDQLAREAKAFLSPMDAQKVKRLYYGVDAPGRRLDEAARRSLRASLGLDEEGFLAGLFGRIETDKGQYLLVEALGRAQAEGVGMQALMVGHAMQEDYLAELKDRVKRRDLSRSVVFQDFVENPQDWMRICDCVVLATHEETFGLVLVEAMRAGVAVIGSDRGGVPEIIDHEKTGLLFESGKSRSLYRCLARLKNDPGLRARLALAGKEKADAVFASEAHFRALREHMAG